MNRTQRRLAAFVQSNIAAGLKSVATANTAETRERMRRTIEAFLVDLGMEHAPGPHIEVVNEETPTKWTIRGITPEGEAAIRMLNETPPLIRIDFAVADTPAMTEKTEPTVTDHAAQYPKEAASPRGDDPETERLRRHFQGKTEPQEPYVELLSRVYEMIHATKNVGAVRLQIDTVDVPGDNTLELRAFNIIAGELGGVRGDLQVARVLRLLADYIETKAKA